jgi:hypothetical protein
MVSHSAHSVVPIHPMGENINLMSNSKFHKKVGEVWHFLLQIDEQFAQKTIFTPKVGLFFKCLSLPIRRRGIRV